MHGVLSAGRRTVEARKPPRAARPLGPAEATIYIPPCDAGIPGVSQRTDCGNCGWLPVGRSCAGSRLAVFACAFGDACALSRWRTCDSAATDVVRLDPTASRFAQNVFRRRHPGRMPNASGCADDAPDAGLDS